MAGQRYEAILLLTVPFISGARHLYLPDRAALIQYSDRGRHWERDGKRITAGVDNEFLRERTLCQLTHSVSKAKCSL